MMTKTNPNFILLTNSCPLVFSFTYQCFTSRVHAVSYVPTNNTIISLTIVVQLHYNVTDSNISRCVSSNARIGHRFYSFVASLGRNSVMSHWWRILTLSWRLLPALNSAQHTDANNFRPYSRAP